MLKTPAIKQIGYKLVLLCITGVPAYGNLIVPASQWGTATAGGHAYTDVPNYHSPNPSVNTTYCFISATVSTCNLSISSNLAPDGNPYHDQNTGTSNSFVQASVDGNGAHLQLSADASGEANSSVDGYVDLGDTITNTTGSTVQFQLGFHLDATVYGVSGASSTFSAQFNAGNVNMTLGQASLYNTGSGLEYDVDQDFLTPLISVAPNSSIYWGVGMSGTVMAASSANAHYLAGYPFGYVNAGNTLSVTSFSVFDAIGDALPVSTFSSADNFDYNGTTAPEPASIGLLSAGLALLGWRRQHWGARPRRC